MTDFHIVNKSEWPGKLAPGAGRWAKNELYLAIRNLAVDGEVITVECDRREMTRIRSWMTHDESSRAKANQLSWTFETTYQGGVLYIRKVAITE